MCIDLILFSPPFLLLRTSLCSPSRRALPATRDAGDSLPWKYSSPSPQRFPTAPTPPQNAAETHSAASLDNFSTRCHRTVICSRCSRDASGDGSCDRRRSTISAGSTADAVAAFQNCSLRDRTWSRIRFVAIRVSQVATLQSPRNCARALCARIRQSCVRLSANSGSRSDSSA